MLCDYNVNFILHLTDVLSYLSCLTKEASLKDDSKSESATIEGEIVNEFVRLFFVG